MLTVLVFFFYFKNDIDFYHFNQIRLPIVKEYIPDDFLIAALTFDVHVCLAEICLAA